MFVFYHNGYYNCIMAIHKKRFLFTFIFALFSWAIWLFVLATIAPGGSKELFFFPFSYVYFFIPLLLAIFLTSTLLLGHTRRGFFITLGVFCLLTLRLLKITNFLTVGLLAASLVVFELYFYKERG